MKFSKNEREKLLNTHMVGAKVVERLEQAGFSNFEKLKNAEYKIVCEIISGEIGSTCWKNSPQAQLAIRNAIETAKKS